jgi:predicted transcriptional regulator
MANTQRKTQVWDALVELYNQRGEPVGPTDIGMHLGFPYQSASSRVMAALKQLVQEGQVVRNERGKYAPCR